MSKISDKIKMIDPNDESYKQALWKLLIAYGGACELVEESGWGDRPFYNLSEAVTHGKNWNYYGGIPAILLELTQEMLKGIREHGIDWDKTTLPETGGGDEFDNTFTSSNLTVHFIVGLLVLRNGDEYIVWTNSGEVEFGSLVRLLTSNDITLGDALDDLEERLTGHYSYVFPFSCRTRI